MDSILDKGVSAGENSILSLRNLNIFNSNIAIASKDRSKVEMRDIELIENNIGITAFEKKSEFGPSSIEGQLVQMKNINIPYLIEKNSFCRINDNVIESNEKNLKELLYIKTDNIQQ